MEKEYDKVAVRLTQILLKLNANERLTLEELAQEFNVSIRTIQRDLHDRFAFLPIEKNDGYYSLKEYCLGKLSFNDIKLFANLSGIGKLYPSLNQQFLVDLLNERVNAPYIVNSIAYEDVSDKETIFQILHIAILKHNILKFSYNEKMREVNPYNLVNTNGIWYLLADENNKLKTFSINKIQNLCSTSKIFKVSSSFENEIKKNNVKWVSSDIKKAVLYIDKKIQYFFERRDIFHTQKILEKIEDGIIVEVFYSYEDEFLSQVQYWIPNIKIIEPTALADKMKDILISYTKSLA